MVCLGPFLSGLGASESKWAPLAVKFLSDTTVEPPTNTQPNHINTHTQISTYILNILTSIGCLHTSFTLPVPLPLPIPFLPP